MIAPDEMVNQTEADDKQRNHGLRWHGLDARQAHECSVTLPEGQTDHF
jgi:hypothetical protein